MAGPERLRVHARRSRSAAVLLLVAGVALVAVNVVRMLPFCRVNASCPGDIAQQVLNAMFAPIGFAVLLVAVGAALEAFAEHLETCPGHRRA